MQCRLVTNLTGPRKTRVTISPFSCFTHSADPDDPGFHWTTVARVILKLRRLRLGKTGDFFGSVRSVVTSSL